MIRQDRVDALLAFVAKHGATYHLHRDFSQFNDLTEAEAQAAADKLRAGITVEMAKLARLKRRR